MTWQCVKCDTPIEIQFDACGKCGAHRAVSIAVREASPLRLRFSLRTLLLAMTLLAPTFLLSAKVWEQILLALAVGSIATAVGVFLTRALVDLIYRGIDRWTRRR
ncbi:hypothetical protein [Lacipirellula parvula]|uniref:Uncharacterized protein n=1 Tax=Lacipirellula parvula TaxID=2650471 RepID=A0A5K7XMR8_9BACT|nr:hypothetical protein [Lacipirellula parvula]BBO36186.1 hypothetical protein PLANPX_5798 [Lacipirellula parvula]